MMRSDRSVSDERLFELIKDGNGEAFAEIYNRYWDKLYQVASHKLGDGFMAQEVVQELFINFWKRREEIVIQQSAARYLAAALKYRIINARVERSRSAKQMVRWENELSDTLGHFQEPMRFAELQEKLESVVTDLPDKSRLIYKMSREDGLSHKQIASQLDISEKAVEYHLTKVLKILRDKILKFNPVYILFKKMYHSV